MSSTRRLTDRQKENLLIFFSWLCYTASYVGRYSFNANINPIMEEYGVTHGDAGLVTTCFFFAYGAGQIINGFLCQYYPKRQVIAGALAVSAIINLTAFAGLPFAAFKFLWFANGASLSVLWSSLVLTISERVSTDRLDFSIIVMNSTVAAGNFLAYALASLFSGLGVFRLSFLVAALLTAVSATLWILFYPAVTDLPLQTRTGRPEKKKDKPKMEKSLLTVLILLGIFAVAVNLIKDGLHTWTPSVLSETYGFANGNSVLLTMVINIASIGGTWLVTVLKKKVRDFAVLSALLYCGIALFLGATLIRLEKSFLTVFSCFLLIIILSHAINAVITGVAPMLYRRQCNPGLLSGLLNGCCYVGSTISSYGLGSIADAGGWHGAFLLLFLVSCCMTVIGIVYSIIRFVSDHKKELSK